MNKNYIVSLLEKDIRDGRKLDEFREIEVETGVSKNAEGSARVKIGDTEVIAGIKMDVGTPFADSPDSGVLMVGVELLPLSSPDFETGPPGKDAVELARIVDRGIRESKMIDMGKLCITKGEAVWMIFIDIYTINDDGNLIDASALASLMALKSAVFPKLDGDKVKFGEFTKNRLPLTRLPVTCTLYKIKDKIIIDPNLDEQKAVDARLTVAISEDGNLNAMQKGGLMGLDIETIDLMIKMAGNQIKNLRKYIK